MNNLRTAILEAMCLNHADGFSKKENIKDAMAAFHKPYIKINKACWLNKVKVMIKATAAEIYTDNPNTVAKA